MKRRNRKRKSKSARPSSISTIVKSHHPFRVCPAVKEPVHTPSFDGKVEMPRSLSETPGEGESVAIYLDFPTNSEMAADSTEIPVMPTATSPSVPASKRESSPTSTPLPVQTVACIRAMSSPPPR